MLSLWQKDPAEYIFEVDIKSCFDNISHKWLLNNAPMDKVHMITYADDFAITDATKDIIQMLNLKLLGWANYYKSLAAKKIFSYVDSIVSKMLWKWIHLRHPRKSAK
ncbi:hypothetical protein NF27_BP00020 [Candidatus Jidaibacter acanthamoeba]|uniref:Group II intron maturase-specific domain-containing protein n=1 Tax=Candidatus Jidaibacter acanthamoebae TaxID=86105 RepID=A0A0C1R1B0_9RICK|nr:group II intron maturase-specific domain-containing protein [Candidatus Jidaibacter acanthamoeba]KIE06045.1 hypothetical protein NF27_CB00020 [Candidatus Jidaibacter acanthamoeba]KIE06070.1 hypothetical protein NF27_BP00020 [Candidatus Jidaibacter acanthamoeba]